MSLNALPLHRPQSFRLYSTSMALHLTQIPPSPRPLYFPSKRHTVVDVYAEAKEGGPDRPQHPGNRAVPLQKIVLDRLSKENKTPSI